MRKAIVSSNEQIPDNSIQAHHMATGNSEASWVRNHFYSNGTQVGSYVYGGYQLSPSTYIAPNNTVSGSNICGGGIVDIYSTNLRFYLTSPLGLPGTWRVVSIFRNNSSSDTNWALALFVRVA